MRSETAVSRFLQRFGPWALVTGASSGIGAEFARQLAKQKFNLVLVARRKQRLDALAQQLERDNAIQTRVVPVDLTQADFMHVILAETDAIEIGLLVNNAGFGLAGRFIDHEMEKELDLLNVNCRAPLLLSHVFARRMAKRKRGGIIMVSSVSGFISTPYEATYAASKVYELFLAESLRYELINDGIEVLALCPGSTDTEFHSVSGSAPVAAMVVGPVVRAALEKLGKAPVTIPGWHNRMLVGLLKVTPRRWHTFFAGRVMRKLIAP
ncbi:MAG: SDR family NAD(P)-dependent oxidoreductase [Chloroflexota bacterium]